VKRPLILLGAFVLASALMWRVVLAVLALLVLAALVRRFAGGGASDRVLVVRVLEGAPVGLRIDLIGGVPGRSREDIRAFVAELDLSPGAVLWVIRDGAELRVRGNHRVPEHLQQRFADFVAGR
jgi:hypothetical protein